MADDRLLDMNEANKTAAVQQVETFLPGVVISFDADQYTVDVDVQIETEYLDDDEDAGETSFVPHARLNDLPVTVLKAGGYSLTFPISVGDTGRVVVPSKSLHEWFDSGKSEQPLDPYEFPVDSAVFVPDLQPDAGRNGDYASDSAVLAGDLLRVGSKNALLTLVRADLLSTEINKVIAAVNEIKPFIVPLATAASAPPALIASITAPLIPVTPAAVESTQVKVDK